MGDTDLNQKLSDWASIAEIIGAVAVVVSLIYVGLQVNDNTSAIRSTATNDATVTMQAWYLEMGSNRQASDIWFDGISSHVPIDTHDEFQYMMSMHSAMMGMQNSYLLSQEGTIDIEFREATTRAIVAVKDLPSFDQHIIIVSFKFHHSHSSLNISHIKLVSCLYYVILPASHPGLCKRIFCLPVEGFNTQIFVYVFIGKSESRPSTGPK